MSTLKVSTVQLGNGAAQDNFLLEAPIPPNGTLTLKKGDGTGVFSVDAAGKVTFPNTPAITYMKDVTGVSGNNVLAVGEAIRQTVNSTLIDLKVACSPDELYEIYMIANSYGSSSSIQYWRPNGVDQGSTFTKRVVHYAAGNTYASGSAVGSVAGYITSSIASIVALSAFISTKTSNKAISFHATSVGSSGGIANTGTLTWQNTSTPLTTLGHIYCTGAAWAGEIVIRRVR